MSHCMLRMCVLWTLKTSLYVTEADKWSMMRHLYMQYFNALKYPRTQQSSSWLNNPEIHKELQGL